MPVDAASHLHFGTVRLVDLQAVFDEMDRTLLGNPFHLLQNQRFVRDVVTGMVETILLMIKVGCGKWKTRTLIISRERQAEVFSLREIKDLLDLVEVVHLEDDDRFILFDARPTIHHEVHFSEHLEIFLHLFNFLGSFPRLMVKRSKCVNILRIMKAPKLCVFRAILQTAVNHR